MKTGLETNYNSKKTAHVDKKKKKKKKKNKENRWRNSLQQQKNMHR